MVVVMVVVVIVVVVVVAVFAFVVVVAVVWRCADGHFTGFRASLGVSPRAARQYGKINDVIYLPNCLSHPTIPSNLI